MLCRSAIADTNKPSHSELTLEALQGSSRIAVDEQAVARVFYDLEHAKLSDLAHYLGGAARLHKVQDYDRARNISNELSLIFEQLQRLQADYDASASPSHPGDLNSSAPLQMTTPPAPKPANSSRKRTRPDIIGASPEKASKRQKSYGVH